MAQGQASRWPKARLRAVVAGETPVVPKGLYAARPFAATCSISSAKASISSTVV